MTPAACPTCAGSPRQAASFVQVADMDARQLHDLALPLGRNGYGDPMLRLLDERVF